MRIPIKSLKFKIKIASLTGVLFGLVSLLFYFGDWSRLILVSTIGFSVGAIAAPEIDSSLFKNGWVYQVLGGFLGGGAISILFTTEIDFIFSVSVFGGMVGWLGPFWVKHIQVP